MPLVITTYNIVGVIDRSGDRCGRARTFHQDKLTVVQPDEPSLSLVPCAIANDVIVGIDPNRLRVWAIRNIELRKVICAPEKRSQTDRNGCEHQTL